MYSCSMLLLVCEFFFFFFSSRRRHTRFDCDWSSDVCSSDLRNRVQALKIAAYGSTPYWLGGVLAVFPKLSLLGAAVALYSIRLFAAGLPPVMKAPRDKTAAFTLLVRLAGAPLGLLISADLRTFRSGRP